ncbi:caspase family protein [Nostocaceae cyanobacterium CENA369]|uniref:Caspase family protein n=1 Tax=Dendronalium phyllosphericum CENA369 TaxID=1725256 RepID=A0A8J7LB53_9NOST|nr:caspase family protein [Dendronalium phyllosphericum]MBH8571552.1 caspase family protein [Dendronalium phyllosphericum CENA369]
MTEETHKVPNLYALLIGIDCYMPNILPDGSYYKSLGGCVRDINHVEAFLKDTQKVPDTQILKLTASINPDKPDKQQPLEPPEKLPTRKNIIDSFRKLGEIAPQTAQVYIQYSGHGGRAKTVFPEIKGVGEIDEGLVPTDIGTSEGQYLRDLELAQLLKELVDKKLTVTLVLDCCHSGGATRGDAEIRGMDVEDDKPLQATFEPVAPLEVLAATWQSLGGGTRGLKASGVPESRDYVLLAACRQNEYAYEYAFNRETRERNGALTYWLLDTLRQQNPGQTYKDLYDRIHAQIHSQFPSQTPILLGEGDRLIFGTERVKTVFAVPVMKVEQTETKEMRVLLAVGQANGVTKGAEFAIYPRATTDLTEKENRVAIARIIQRGGTDSLCKLEAIAAKELKVEPGDLAVQIAVAASLVRKVSLSPEGEQNQKALAVLKAAIPGNGWVELDETRTVGDNGEGVDYFVEINNNGEFEIRDSGGAIFQNIKPAFKIDDPTAPEKIVKRLVHLAKYQAAKTIDNVDTDSPLSGKLVVEWMGTSDTYDRGDPIPTISQLQKFSDRTRPTVKIGDSIFLSIRNNSTETLNVAVLNFESDWSIQQIHPQRPTELFITLEPGKEEKIPLQPTLEGEGNEVENTVKVFATKDQANFRWLELPSLDEEIVQKGFAARPLNPLEALLAAIDGEQPTTRKLTVAASPSREWTTKQVTLIITK